MNDRTRKLLDELNQETGVSFSVDDSEDNAGLAKVLTKLIRTYRGESDPGFFLKKLLLGELSREEIEEKSVVYHFDKEATWCVFLMSFKAPYEPYMLRMISSLYIPGADHTVEMDPTHLVLVRELKKGKTRESLRKMAETLVDMLGSEAMISVKISYDQTIEDFTRLPESYRNVCRADAIGRLFLEDRSVYGYHELGTGKLIYSLPREVCQEFLDDHLGGFDLRDLDPETRNTIRVFFDSGLSLAETARALYIHRNTLGYRIEKIEKQTGLDIRRFEDAMVMKLALMISDFLGDGLAST
ncbi:PucR family transcriptional regulator [Candidatus Weimeria sp. HCP3S3_B5]|uniref:PucR family transcriptional regulator n=1 Tax=Candidatus Weimeria sp. HCP3S3_B5 TaxID=3438871 RepID=UPI002A956F54|nr:helix-turn-helix domain-containing protein [Lachnospiraceae bacterium]